MPDDGAPKIQIDSDWKAEAQKEKQRLASQSAPASAAGDKEAPTSSSGGGQKVGFQTLLSTMVTQALFAMGAIPDPQTGQRMAHLELARHHIDMLAVLEEKTKGNLTQQESDTLATTIYELRNQYVNLVAAAHKQAEASVPGSGQVRPEA